MILDTINNQILLDRFETASKGNKECHAKDNGGSVAEKVYGKAYQALVRAGLRMQIKKKYRDSNG